MQSKTMSIVEIVSSKSVGFLMALSLTYWIVPEIWGVEVGTESAIFVTGLYTLVAFIRSYIFRRLFNWVSGKTDLQHNISNVKYGFVK
jgi:hypothetical protein